MRPLPALAAALALTAWCATDAVAHGGTHPTPFPTGAPSKPTKPGKGSSAFTKGIRSTRWEDWWYLNRARYLRIDRRRPTLTGDGETTRFIKTPAGQFLREALRDAYWDTRAAACLAFGKAADPEDARELKPRAFDENEDVRGAAMMGLGLLHADLRATEVLKVFENRKEKPKLRGFAALALGLSRDPAAVTPLAKRLLDSSDEKEVRAAAALALGPLGQLSAIPHLRRILDNVNQPDVIRAMCMTAMGRLAGVGYAKRAAGEDPAKDIADAPDKASRVAAAMRDPDYVHELLLRLMRGDRQEAVRRAGVLAIARLARPDDVPAMMRSVYDTDYGVEVFALLSLGEMAKGTKYIPQVLPLLTKKATTGKYPGTKAWAALGLALMGDRSAGPTLLNVFLHGKHQTLRGAGAIALGLLRYDKAVEPLLDEATKRGNPTLRAQAVFALGLLGAKRVMPPLKKILYEVKTPDIKAAAAAALAASGLAQDIGELAKMLQERSTYLRMAAIQALGILRDDVALRHLIDHYRTETTDEVRAVTVVAVGNIVAREPVSAFQDLARDVNYLVHVPCIEMAIRLR